MRFKNQRFPFSGSSKSLGSQGEAIAARYLEEKGLVIIALNWRAGRLGEVDIIAVDPTQPLLILVEVKTRQSNRFGSPAESVNELKQQQLFQLTECYLQQNPQYKNYQIRFDVVSILLSPQQGVLELTHLDNAFSN